MVSVRKLPIALFQSGVAMSWAAIAARLGGTTLLLLLLTTRLTTEEIAIWLTFNVVINLQTVMDFGFGPTYVRLLSYACGRTAVSEHTQTNDGITDAARARFSFEEISASVRRTYGQILVFSLLVIAVVGSWGVSGPIARAEHADQHHGWLAWAMVAVACGLGTFQNRYIVTLHGRGLFARQRAYDAALALGSSSISCAVLLIGGGLVSLAVVALAAAVVSLATYRHASRQIIGSSNTTKLTDIPPGLRSVVWNSAWRSGLGMMLSLGVTQIILLAFARFFATADAARYLLGVQIMQVISALAQSPFYSKIPHLAQLYAQGRMPEIIKTARGSMLAAHWILVIGVIITGAAAPPLLKLAGSNAGFPELLFWFTLGAATFVERFGAMHLQLYTLTHHVIWHITNAITALILLVFTAVLTSEYGPLGYPFAMLIAYLSFYSWYSARISYRTLSIDAWSFERNSAVYPAVTMAVALAFAFLTVTKSANQP